MAKLSAYYTLCPLIDQQNLLGVEQDKESGWAIVTLGRNMVIRYKVRDRLREILIFFRNEFTKIIRKLFNFKVT